MASAASVSADVYLTCPERAVPYVNEFSALLEGHGFDGARAVVSDTELLFDCIEDVSAQRMYGAFLADTPEWLRNERERCTVRAIAGGGWRLVLLVLPEIEADLMQQRCQRSLEQLPLAVSLSLRGLERSAYQRQNP